MERELQRICFPKGEKFEMHWGLFYKGPRCLVENDASELHIPAGICIDFATYLNGFPLNKWKRYTDLRGVRLSVSLQGHATVALVGYSLNPFTADRHEYLRRTVNAEQPQTIELDYPDVGEEFLAFEILAHDKTVVTGGSFWGEYAPESENQVVLAIATTTCKKEEFIQNNVRLIREELLGANAGPIAQNLYVHVVDNGRTLQAADIEAPHVFLHPNPNTGGSGGYARGMIEALHQQPAATHVLLMDDDVIVLPESIRRTYTLLTLLRPEYSRAYVAGAMMEYDAMFLQHEDVGSMQLCGDLCPIKPPADQNVLDNVIRTNKETPYVEHQYSGWWYCCIPTEMVRENGLPMPFFIRADDMEYGLRSKTTFLTMTGIGIWHMGFGNKYNAAMDLYQILRNFLIAQATGDVLQDVDVIGRLKREYRQKMLEFCYDSAELVVKALEDFLRGPAYLKQVNGEKLMMENRKLNETMKPLSAFPGIEVRLERVYDNPPRKRLEKWVYRLTYNGQRFWPQSWLKTQPAVIGYDWSYQPQMQSLRKTLLAVNPVDRTASLRTIDKKRFRELQARYRKAMRSYRRNKAALESAYAAAKKELTSEPFWKQYLGLQ